MGKSRWRDEVKMVVMVNQQSVSGVSQDGIGPYTELYREALEKRTRND